jgi:tetratricopeptide (TPR) repeat protein
MSQRLERALAVFLDSQERRLPREQVLAAHPELAELLAPLLDGEGAAADGGGGPCFGPYRVRREIGRGGMGVVYEATHRALDRAVALKVLGHGFDASPGLIARFQREARTLARLDHPHVVRILDVGETGGHYWLAMELVDGCSLEARLDELRQAGGHRGASLRQLVEAIAAIADALQHVHAANLLHRDVKPSNILLRRDGHALLGDFGLARDDAAPSMTQVGVIVGTPHYMSPEHLAGGGSLSAASDVFSLGATLYECITLRRPFDGGSNEVVLQQILLHEPTDPRRLQPGLPGDLAAIVGKALEKDPARRYPTAAAFAADLRAFLELKPVQARPPSALVRLRRWARREPWRAALATVLSVCGLLGGYLALQWPVLRAAAAARTDRAFEDAMSAGWMHRTSNRRDECLAAFRAALALRPPSAEAIAGLCMALRQFDGGEPALAELDRRAPGADDPLLLQRARAVMLQALGRNEEAAVILATLPPPRTTTDLWFAGTATLVAGDQDPMAARVALEQLSLAVRMSPMPRLTMVVQWTIAAYKARDQAALREAGETLLQLWPQHPFALHYAALAVGWTDLDRAIDLCRQARAAGMEPRESHWLEVSLLTEADRSDELLTAVRQTLQYTWDDRRTGILIDLLTRLGDGAEADDAVEAWVRAAPDSPEAIERLVTMRARDGDDAGAILLAQDLVARRPEDPEARIRLAELLAEQRYGGAARELLTQALAIRPDYEPAHRRLLAMLDTPADAPARLAELRRWASIRPADADAHASLANALLQEVPPLAEEALAAAVAADYLTAGKDPAILECRAAAHEALGEAGPARRCRAQARALGELKVAPAATTEYR